MVFVIPDVGCDETAPAEPTGTPPKTAWVVLLRPDSVPEGSRIFRGDEQVATVSEAEQSRLFKLRDPLKPGRKIERKDRFAEFELGQAERIHGVEWTLRQPTPCGDHVVALEADGPSSKEQEQEARDAVKPVEDPRRVANNRAIFIELSFDTNPQTLAHWDTAPWPRAQAALEALPSGARQRRLGELRGQFHAEIAMLYLEPSERVWQTLLHLLLEPTLPSWQQQSWVDVLANTAARTKTHRSASAEIRRMKAQVEGARYNRLQPLEDRLDSKA